MSLESRRNTLPQRLTSQVKSKNTENACAEHSIHPDSYYAKRILRHLRCGRNVFEDHGILPCHPSSVPGEREDCATSQLDEAERGIHHYGQASLVVSPHVYLARDLTADPSRVAQEGDGSTFSPSHKHPCVANVYPQDSRLVRFNSLCACCEDQWLRQNSRRATITQLLAVRAVQEVVTQTAADNAHDLLKSSPATSLYRFHGARQDLSHVSVLLVGGDMHASRGRARRCVI